MTEFRILGPLEVLEEGRSLDLGGQQQRALLALLLLEANRVVSRDRLIHGLWEDDPPDTAHKALQVYVSNLRKRLGRDRIVTNAPGYAVRVEPGELDFDRFERLAADGGREQLVEALALWRGQPLEEFAHRRFALSEIGRIEERRLAVLEARIEADLAVGRQAELIPELESLVAEHPLRERLRALLMLALYRNGRQAEALEAYQDARRALVDELGIEPGHELRELHQTILNQDPALDLSGSAAGAPVAPAEDEIGDRLQALSGECRRVLSLASVLGQEFGLVALERVADYTGIDRLLRVLDEAIEARIVEQAPGSLGWLRFVHAVTRETLYEEIPAPHRARLHRRVAEVLEALYAIDPEPHRDEVAHHLALADQG
jgi:DNA-binding SARP family transcriptional activator